MSSWSSLWFFIWIALCLFFTAVLWDDKQGFSWGNSGGGVKLCVTLWRTAAKKTSYCSAIWDVFRQWIIYVTLRMSKIDLKAFFSIPRLRILPGILTFGCYLFFGKLTNMALRKDNDCFRLAVIVLLRSHSHVGWCIEMVWINSIILG